MNVKSIPDDSFVKALPPSGELAYVRSWISASRADCLFSRLIAETEWESRTIRMFGRQMMQPRKIAFQGDPGVEYVYSGGLYRAAQWHPQVAKLRDALVAETGCRFNCVLLNLYRDGRDSMGWHSDDEPELGREPTVASVSLGGARRFVLRPKTKLKNRGDACHRFSIVPGHGSLIVMRGDIQHFWQHQLPKTQRSTSPRINLTFRKIVRPPKELANPRP